MFHQEFLRNVQVANDDCGPSTLRPACDESAHHWTRRVTEIIHLSDNITAAQAVLILEKNCHFQPLVQKLGRLKRKVQDLGKLMDVLTRYAESDSTKDPGSDEDKTAKGKKAEGGKGQHGHSGN